MMLPSAAEDVYRMETGNPKHIVHLRVTSGPNEGRMIFLQPKQEALVGRVMHANLRLTDPACSGQHCMIRSVGDMVFIEDLGSKNGTLVNGDPITTRVLDEAGEITVGESTISLAFVTTEREVPSGEVDSAEAPTLLEPQKKRATTDPALKAVGSQTTIPDHAQLAEFHAARNMLGKNVGGYLLLELCGIGGLGVVYRAKNVDSKEQVAVKLIRKDQARTPELLARFMDKTEVGIVVPGAARLLAVGEDGAYAFIAMDHVRGRGVQSLMDLGQKFTYEDIVTWIEPLGETFLAIHARNRIHGDIRPANIVLSDDGRPTVLDLGMAWKLDKEGRFILNKKEEMALRMPYMPPELSLQKTHVDPRTDIYCLGATLWAVLVGRPPFVARKTLNLVRKIRWEDPVLASDAKKGIPAPVAKVLAKCMEKEPERRFQTFDELVETLKAVVE